MFLLKKHTTKAHSRIVGSLAQSVSKAKMQNYLMKLVMVLATVSGGGNSFFAYPITFMIHAMFLPKTAMICFPSASCSIFLIIIGGNIIICKIIDFFALCKPYRVTGKVCGIHSPEKLRLLCK